MTVINRYPNDTSEKDLKALAYQAYLLLSAMNLQTEIQDIMIVDNESNNGGSRKSKEAT